MASQPDRAGLPTWLAATALAALAWWFGSGLQPLWWAAWLAPLPVLWLAPRVRARWAALAAFAAYAGGSLNTWTYLHGYIGLPLAVIAAFLALPGIMLTLCALLYRRLLRRGHALAAACAPPATWVAMEYATSRLSPHGTFFAIGYTQMDALPVIQLASVAGLWGIGFLMLLAPTALAVQAAPQASRRGRLAAAATTAALLAGMLAYGAWRLQAPATSMLRVGLVSLGARRAPALDSAEGRALAARYADAAARLAGQGAQAVVIPETSLVVSGATIPAFAALARQRQLTLDAGVDFRGEPGTERNMAMVFQPGAAAPLAYSKHHLIPGFEAQYTPGNSEQMLAGAPRTGLAICKDMDFLDTGHAYAGHRAQLLLVPAWDFVVDGWLHSRMAVMRGIENGFAVARAARRGRLTLSDDRGRVVAEASSEQGDAELVDDLPLRETRTLYARWGDAFAWLDVAGLVALVALALAKRPSLTGSGGT